MTKLSREGKKNLFREILGMAWPAIMRMSFMTTVSVITMALVGSLGATPLAAVGLAQRLVFLAVGTMMALTVGTTALVARYVGAREEERAQTVMAQSIILGVLLGITVAIAAYFWADEAMSLMMWGKPDPEVIALGSRYLVIIAAAMVLNLPMMTVNAAQQGAGDMLTPMYMMLGVNALTVLLGYSFIFGLGPFPALGLTGAALGEGLARSLGGIAALILAFNPHTRLHVQPGQLLHLDRVELQRLVAIGVPAALEQWVRQSSQIIYTMLVASLGIAAMAANQIVMTVQSVSFMPGFGFGLAATTLVGQALGAKRPVWAERYGWGTNLMAAYFMGLMGIIFFIWSRPLAQFFVEEPEVVDLAAASLRIVAFAQLPFAVVMVLSGALRGAGDTRWVMYLTAIGQWGVRLVFSYLLGLKLGYGLAGIWVAMTLDVGVRALLTLARYRSGRWKTVFPEDQPSAGEVASSRV